ncbi:MAG TPA: glycine oxidase ThiO [Candidatus Dormibacteraeota bacterium]
MKVAIVGGGVIGCAIADRLARDGHQVTLFERDRVGAHASGAAAGLLAPYSEADEPGEFHRFAVRSLAMFDELGERLQKDTGIDVEFRHQETLRIALDDAAHDTLGRRVAWQLEAGLQPWLLTADEARAEEPELGEVVGAAVFPEAQVTPPRMVAALAWSAAAAGADVREGAPVTLVERSGRVEGVRTFAGVEGADVVVLAAGPWSPQVAQTAGVEVEVRPRRGQLIALEPPRGLLRHMITAGHLYLVPKPAGELICGSTEEEARFEAHATGAGVRLLLDFAIRAVPALADARVDRVWAALRPAPRGRMPLIGPAEIEGLVLATGHNRNGILQAPLTADIVARGLAGTWETPEP